MGIDRENEARKGTCNYIGACRSGCELGSAINAAIKLPNPDKALVVIGDNQMFRRCPQMGRFRPLIEAARR